MGSINFSTYKNIIMTSEKVEAAMVSMLQVGIEFSGTHSDALVLVSKCQAVEFNIKDLAEKLGANCWYQTEEDYLLEF